MPIQRIRYELLGIDKYKLRLKIEKYKLRRQLEAYIDILPI